MNVHAWIKRLEAQTEEQTAFKHHLSTSSECQELAALLKEYRDIVASFRTLESDGPYHGSMCGDMTCSEPGCECLGENSTDETIFEHPCVCGLDAFTALLAKAAH